MLLTHFIERKGKGGWVLAVPMIVSVTLATLNDGLNLTEKYFTPAILLLSATIIWLVDVISKTNAAKQNRVVKNTFMWIGMKYWAVALAIVGTGLSIQLA